jgi:SNF family Na+-dependent transporter
MSVVVDSATGLYNKAYANDFWCPARAGIEPPRGFNISIVRPAKCPAVAAVQFWERQALQQSSGMDDLGGFHPGMLLAYTLAWLLVYLCIFKGIASSGKVVYVTATLPYIALVAFFIRAVTLPNALTGIRFFVEPDFGLLFNAEVWIRASTQIFYSLGVGFGSLVAFGSYGARSSDFVKEASKVSLINCGTSVFAGFVVFPILGYLAHELSGVNPCIHGDDLSGLASIGLSGTGLAFVAFPIAISQMSGSFFWAILFFITLLCLGIDSQFAMVESVMTVLIDAGFGAKMPRPAFAGIVCFVSYIIGLVFVTRGGIYWFELFDYYSCLVALFVVTVAECIGLMWIGRGAWPSFVTMVVEYTGRQLDSKFFVGWKFICPALLVVLTAMSLKDFDLMHARESTRYPEGSGYKPEWSIWVGWFIALFPCIGLLICAIITGSQATAVADPDAENGLKTPTAEILGKEAAAEEATSKRVEFEVAQDTAVEAEEIAYL